MRAQVAQPSPATPAKKQDDGGWLLFLALLGSMIVALFVWQFRKQQRWLDGRIAAAFQQMKLELPPLFLGEYLTKNEFADYRERLEQFETQSRYLQECIDRLSRRLVLHDREDKN